MSYKYNVMHLCMSICTQNSCTLMSMMSALLVLVLYSGWGVTKCGFEYCSIPSYLPRKLSPATIIIWSTLSARHICISYMINKCHVTPETRYRRRDTCSRLWRCDGAVSTALSLRVRFPTQKILSLSNFLMYIQLSVFFPHYVVYTVLQLPLCAQLGCLLRRSRPVR